MARALLSSRMMSAIVPLTWGIAIAVIRPPWYIVGITGLAVWGVMRRRTTARTRLKFTREGRYLVAITLGVGFAAVNTGNNLLYLVLGMLLSMIVVSGILSEQTLRRLKVERELPRTVHAGRPFLTAITLTNDKKRLPSFSVQVEDLLAAGGAKKCYFLKVPAGARQQTSYRAVVEHRGLHRYVGLRLGTRFPFAFFVKSRQITVDDALVVYPRIHPVDALPLSANALIGVLTRPRKGMGREFHGLRAYRMGDDARDVHWKRSAREGRLVLREYASQGARRVVIQVNTVRPPDAEPGPATPSMDDAPTARLLDASCDLAASLALHLQRRGYRVQMRCGPRAIDISDQGVGLDAALHALAMLDFDTLQCAAPLPQGVPAILVTPAETRALAGAGFAHVVEPA